MKMKFLSLMFFVIILFLSSNMTYAPGGSVPAIQNEQQPPANPVKLVGMWPYGDCQASAVDTTRNIALIGNGETLQVLDISTPSSLSKIGEVNLKGSTQDITISGNYAYLVTRSYLKIVDISDVTGPYESASVYFDESELQSISLSSGYAYVAAGPDGLYIYDVSDPDDPLRLSRYRDNDVRIDDVAIWGNYAICECGFWNFPEQLDFTYGVQIIDISSPSAPSLTGSFTLKGKFVPQGIDVSVDGYAYLCQTRREDEAGRITVIDVVSDPSNPTEVGSYVESGRNFGGITVSGNYAYLCETWPWRLAIFDISSPSYPSYIGQCDADCPGNHIGISGSLVGISNGGSGFSLYDVSNPVSPSRLSNYETPGSTGSIGNGIVVAGDYVYMGSSNDGLRIMDVSDPSNPTVAGLCEDIYVNTGLALSGNYAYCLGGTNTEKLYIVDISSPHSPYRVADIDLPCIDPPCSGFQYMSVEVSASYAYISGTKWTLNGSRATLAVIDISDHSNLRIIGTFVCFYESNSYGKIGLSGNYVYLPLEDLSQDENDSRSGFMAVDISDPRNPTAVYWDYSTVQGSYSSNVAVRGDNVYLTGDMFNVYDISNPARPKFIAYFPVRCASLALSGDYAYLAWDKLMILNISNPYNPYGVIGYEGEWAEGVAVSGNLVYLPGSLYILKNKSAPGVSISTPSALSTLLGSVHIEAKASHSTGIDKVEFYIDGSLKSAETASPYIYTWDTTSFEDGLHKIKVQAYNHNGISSEAEIEVFTRFVYTPLNFSGEKIRNRSLSQTENINVLSWQANPNNLNIAKYRIFLKNGYSRSLLVELSAGTFEYWHRKVGEDEPYTYVLVAVNNEGRESDPASVTVQ